MDKMPDALESSDESMCGVLVSFHACEQHQAGSRACDHRGSAACRVRQAGHGADFHAAANSADATVCAKVARFRDNWVALFSSVVGLGAVWREHLAGRLFLELLKCAHRCCLAACSLLLEAC